MNMTVRTGNISWLTPVYVRVGFGFSDAIRNSRDAYHFLTCLWPAERGQAHAHAVQLCARPSLNTASDDIREAFIRACIEANVLD